MRWEESVILTAKPSGEVSRLAEAQSLRSFVRNVTDFDGLDYHLMKAGRAELGVGGEEDQVARRASKLLLLALCAWRGHRADMGHRTRIYWSSAGGLQLRDDRGKVVEREYAPDRLWYAVPEGDGLRVACALDIPFRVAKRESGEFAIVWTDAMMHSLIRLAIGPLHTGRHGRPARCGPVRTRVVVERGGRADSVSGFV